jgi:hypothetical protein
MQNHFKALIDCLGGRKLILHAGTPKTGSTSLQHWLFKNRNLLLENGILYPSNVLSIQEPKHQWLVAAHHTQASEVLAMQCQLINDEISSLSQISISTVLLSTEGLSNHFFDLIQPRKESWIKVVKAGPVKVIIAFRDPLQYSLSRYRQNLINPPSINPYHATQLSLDELCTDQSWLSSLDYQQIIEFWDEVVGKESMVCLAYKANIIDSFLRFGLDLDCSANPCNQERCNMSIEAIGVHLIRELNKLNLSSDQRKLIIHYIRTAETCVDAKKHPFEHSQLSRRAVMSFCKPRLPALVAERPELTLVLSEVVSGQKEEEVKNAFDDQPIRDQSVAFICCIEPGFLEEQVVRLAQSIRLFAGAYSDYPIYAISPHGEMVSRPVLQQLDALSVTLFAVNLNQDLREFPYANKAYAVEYIQQTQPHDAYIFIDSDTLFIDEPSALYLDETIGFLARPVDMRNTCSSPLDDFYLEYWNACCELAGIRLEDLPIIMSTVDKQIIRANWNGGLLMFHGNKEIGERWRILIEEMWRKMILPKPNNFWGSGQVSFTLAASSLDMRGFCLDHEYNIPLHLPITQTRIDRINRPRHIHYHWLLDQDFKQEWCHKRSSLRLKSYTRAIIEALPVSKNNTKKNITGFKHSP